MKSALAKVLVLAIVACVFGPLTSLAQQKKGKAVKFEKYQGKKKRLLLITESKGFTHGVVRRRGQNPCLVEKIFTELGEKTSMFEVVCSQNSRQELTGENLKKFDAVWFYTTGNLPLSDTQKAELLSFIKNGGGFGGSHSATDTFYKWPAYGKLIGGYFAGHPWHMNVKIIVEDKNHPATKHLGDSFEIKDEIYQFRTPYDRKKLHVLMRLDVESLPKKGARGRRKDKDYAIAWTNTFGKGRIFYTALGHRDSVLNDPRYQRHIIGGLKHIFKIDEKKKSE